MGCLINTTLFYSRKTPSYERTEIQLLKTFNEKELVNANSSFKKKSLASRYMHNQIISGVQETVFSLIFKTDHIY